MALINNIQADILENVGRFSFLSVSQLSVLTGKSLSYLREQLAILKDRNFIKSYHVEMSLKVRPENIYYLTAEGKNYIVSNGKVFADDVKLSIGDPFVVRDYNHRMSFVNLHIALYKYLNKQGVTLVTFLTYFDKKGNRRKDNNLESKTQISLGDEGIYIPDGIMITEHNNVKTLYMIEVFCDKNTQRILQSLAKHGKGIAIGVGKQFNIPANPYILSVFEHEGIKQAVIKRLRENENFTGVSKFFLFATLTNVLENCGSAWHTISDEKFEIT